LSAFRIVIVHCRSDVESHACRTSSWFVRCRFVLRRECNRSAVDPRTGCRGRPLLGPTVRVAFRFRRIWSGRPLPQPATRSDSSAVVAATVCLSRDGRHVGIHGRSVARILLLIFGCSTAETETEQSPRSGINLLVSNDLG